MPEPTAPPLILTLTYWLHMLATVVWIGGLAALSWIVLPAARKTLEPAAYGALLTQIQSRLQQVGWFCLALLALTGMFQMSSNKNYEGFLAITNAWATAILIKHLVIGLMVLVSAYLTWGLLPALKRGALMRAAGRAVDETRLAGIQRREAWLLNLNLGLSIVVLLLTAWARAAG